MDSLFQDFTSPMSFTHSLIFNEEFNQFNINKEIEQEDKDIKKEISKKKNRESARRYRIKHKNEVAFLKRQNMLLSQENKFLRNKLSLCKSCSNDISFTPSLFLINKENKLLLKPKHSKRK